MSQMDLDSLSFADNQDARAPLALVLDCSDSMTEPRPGDTRSPLDALNGGLDTLISELHKDPLARRRVEITVVPYGTHVSEPTPFATIDTVVLPTLIASGVTSSGAAIVRALDALEERKVSYKTNGITYYRPFCLWITDGLSTDDISEAAKRIQEAESRGSVAFFAVGVEGADIDTMRKLSVREPLMLKGLAFEELFQWLSASQAAVSASQVGDRVAMPSPAGWAEI